MQLRAVPFVLEVLYAKNMSKRNLFAELKEGFDALAAARKGKKTLHTTEVELKPAVEVSSDELRAMFDATARAHLNRRSFA